QLHEVGINRDVDIIAYEIIKKFPKTPEFNRISTAITQSGAAITPELVREHLFTLFTDASKKCKTNAHNTLSNHPESRCWKLYPHLYPTFDSSKAKKDPPSTVLGLFFHLNHLHFHALSLILVPLLT
ncbi:hypothetical protein VP01_8283g1, partial [Puccinia sorghi]